MTDGTHRHKDEELCEAGLALYSRALREGHVDSAAATAAPCLIDIGLLHPAVDDLDRLEPITPAVALQRLLRTSEERIARERRRGERLADVFEPLMRLGTSAAANDDTPSLRILSGKERTGQAIEEAMAEGRHELLAIQPHDSKVTKRPDILEGAIKRDQAFLDRGARIRALYQHTARHAPYARARYEHLTGDVEARTLDEVTDRLIIVDRTVAFIPANADRSLALEVRHPALIAYFISTFDRFWHLATPMHPQAVQPPTLNGITPRQRAIAALLIEGHTDNSIAERLGMNVRTARVHIAKLATTLGSESRAQLGYLIGQSGILDPEG
ncbi:LuxR C-terminal-related transcriptional regulator [Streptomyces mutabilis]|uniref:helix-turn-helix transcriptional regulator n=1 Tax=Streptomyces TaxID=1883 RepID=UPI0025B3C57C|nr:MULTISPECIES: helix-turn-helix transcriptional regulator [unclassified Streptomyces]MDN3246718.1 helix-turn-helix transcriptional regulator [Streptomyces sp. ZSW22]MDN3254695.1 helix-turn-helix transcriptional regulator [Streptomyces sp. MA25(2023)]MDQ0386493.1 DNA-binding CsgD family transcriptional regulator/sugar-specific transcriptional regulator TrmB [Streptomyces sp. DSM 42143]